MSAVVPNSPCRGQNQRAIKRPHINLTARPRRAFFLKNMQVIFGVGIAIILAALLLRTYLKQKRKHAQEFDRIFAQVKAILDTPVIATGTSLGSQRLDGQYQNNPVQIQTIKDTLATRKLPSLWLMVTLPAKLPVTAKLDMMLRSAGPTSFSNFDFLTHHIRKPSGFPEQSDLRSDAETGYAELGIVAKHLSFFGNPRAKELLITPQGLRLVILLAEAERGRYVVLREANFTEVQIDADLAISMIETLLALKTALEDHAKL
jgi:hypothetical protein